MPTTDSISRRTILQAGAAIAAVAATGSAFAQTAASQPRVVLITGTSSGFGRLMAEGFARKGDRVIATMRDMSGRNAPAAAELQALGLPIDVIEIDVLSDDSVRTGVARAIELAGRINVVINNAGIAVPGPIELQPAAYFQANIDTNMGGAMRVNRALIPQMRTQGGGTIIQMSSALGRAIDPMLGGYCASKLAVEAMSDALSYELASSRIEVAVVQPAGAYPTKFQANARRYWDEMVESPGAPDRAALANYSQHLEAMLTDLAPDPALNPKEVSDAVIALAEMPFGTRPSRLTVGPYKDGIDPVNAAHDTLQSDMISHNKIVDLLTLK